jgi:hypothetical protein
MAVAAGDDFVVAFATRQPVADGVAGEDAVAFVATEAAVPRLSELLAAMQQQAA